MSTISDKLRRLTDGAAASSGATVTATWNGVVIAESDRTVVVEGNHYFPPEDVRSEYLRKVDSHSVCPWKGTASYYDIVVDGQRNPGAAWYYPTPSDAAAQIRDHVAFWNGVKVAPAARG